MKKFLRLGRIPRNGKSVNFLKMTNDQTDNFSFCADMGDMEQAYEYVPAGAFEPGLSVFRVSQDGFPVLENMRQVFSVCARLEEPMYSVTGEEVGEGNDGEPLISIEGVEFIESIKEWLSDIVQFTLRRNFLNAHYDKSMDFRSDEIHVFCREGREEFCFNGWTFSNPVPGFDASTGIAGRG